MGEYIGRINTTKDTMIFVVNNVFEKGIKESTTKENILKMMPEIYENADEEEIIKLLPYKSYKALEELIKYIKTENDIKKFFYESEYTGVKYLEEAMIIIMRVKHLEYNYSLNPGVIEKLTKIYTKESAKIAERYEKIERLTMGILYTYGVVDFDFLREQICKCMNETITEEELEDLYFKRLNLNIDVDYYDIKWTNTNQTQSFVTYLNEEWDEIDVGDIASEQKGRGLKYKIFKESELLKREEYLWNDDAQKLFEFMKSTNDDIYQLTIERIMKKSELGENILNKLIEKCRFKDDNEVERFMQLYMKWYNNNPQYPLCGYSPNELVKMMK